MRKRCSSRSGVVPGWTRPVFAVLAALLFLPLLPLFPPPPATAAAEEYVEEAVTELNRVRDGLKVEREGMVDRSRYRTSHGRPALEIEGWRADGENILWPIDQATYDIRSSRLSKYVNFKNASRRKAGEAIQPMGSVSARGDGYLALFRLSRELALEGIERFRVRDKESVYYELRYTSQPQDVLSFHPLIKILVDASSGRFYRYELAADYLDAGAMPRSIISGSAASRLAALYLQTIDLGDFLGRGAAIGNVLAPDLYYLRPNRGFGGNVPEGGVARPAWVVPFQTDGDWYEVPHLLFIDAVTGKTIGGVPAGS